jgi:hypothetical protein
MKAPTHKADASARLSDEFPAGYSSTRCSPAVLVSASPAGVDDASGLFQLRGIFNNERSRTEKPEPIHRQRSTLTGQFFCPKNGEYLSPRPQLGDERGNNLRIGKHFRCGMRISDAISATMSMMVRLSSSLLFVR